MIVNDLKVEMAVQGVVGSREFSAAEALDVAEAIVRSVCARLEPSENSVLCVAEGHLLSALHSLEEGKSLVEMWPEDDLPESPADDPVCAHDGCTTRRSQHAEVVSHEYTDR